MASTTETLYEGSADRWERDAPVLLTDFTARPLLLRWCEPVRGSDVLDLGCGEGFLARQLAERGAASLLGIDRSERMVEMARAKEQQSNSGNEYAVADAVDLSAWPAESRDVVIASFLLDELDLFECRRALQSAHRILRPGGRIVVIVHHPFLPFVARTQSSPLRLVLNEQGRGSGYFSARGKELDGEMWRRDGDSVPLRCIYKTVRDYLELMHDASFDSIEVEELGVSNEQLGLDPDFFGPVRDLPLHLAMRSTKAHRAAPGSPQTG